MLRFFRVNDPYRLFAILVVLFLCSLPLFLDPPQLTKQELRNILVGESIADGKLMYVHLYDSTAPFSAVVFAILDWTMGRSLIGRDILALLILFFQAAFFSILLINNRAYNDNTYVPGLIYGLLCFVSFDFLAVSPELLASTVLLLALNNLFREIEFRIQRDETILNVGLFVGLASLFVFSYSLFLIAAFTILGFFTRTSFRKAILLIFGFLLPHGLVFMYYFSWGETALLWRNFYQTGFSLGSEYLISTRSLLFLGALPLTYFVFSLFMLTREARFTKYQSQLFQVMFLWMIFSLGEIFLAKEMTPHSFIPIIPSLTYFFSHYLLLIRRKWIAETALWVLVAGILTINHLAKKGRISSINYSNMFLPSSIRHPQIKGEKVMVLGEELPLYRQNQLGGYFLQWSLAEELVTDMDQYANVLKMNELFEKFPPDIIIDERNLFPAMVARIPRLKSEYRKENGYYRKTTP